MLELKNISFTAETENGDKEILNDISLKFEDSFIAITGPNGGGKSTLAKIISGIYKPTSGKILLDGLEALSKKTKGKIFNVRGKGLLCAFDMKDGEARNKFIDDCMNKENMIVLACGDNSIRFRPFLDITEADVKEGLKRMERVLTAKK